MVGGRDYPAGLICKVNRHNLPSVCALRPDYWARQQLEMNVRPILKTHLTSPPLSDQPTLRQTTGQSISRAVQTFPGEPKWQSRPHGGMNCAHPICL
jgi:hypothetical protein